MTVHVALTPAPETRRDTNGDRVEVAAGRLCQSRDVGLGQTIDKVRDRVQVAAGTSEDELVALALASDRVRAHLDGGEPRRTIVVPDKLVNIVV